MTRTKLSRKTKGAIAAIAGGGLLLATGGTLAYWDAAASLDGDSIVTGSLGLSASSLNWQYINESSAGWQTVPADFEMVPGHTVRGEFTVQATVEGTDLTANLVLGEEGGVPSGIPGANVTWFQADNASGPWTQIDVTAATSPATIVLNIPDAALYYFAVQIELPFEADTATGIDNRSNSFGLENPITWTLSEAHLALVQNSPTTP